MKKIYLVRHGQSQSNAGQGRPRPNAEIELTHLGHQQAERVATHLIQLCDEPIQGIFASTYLRTQQTAYPLLQKLHRQVEILPYLHEFNYLSFQHIKDLEFSQIVHLAEDFWQNAKIDQSAGDDAESFATFMQRVDWTYQQFCQWSAGTYVVFTHGLWISALKWKLLGQGLHGAKCMQKFRAFEMSIRPKNGDIQLLQIGEQQISQIQHVMSVNRVAQNV